MSMTWLATSRRIASIVSGHPSGVIGRMTYELLAAIARDHVALTSEPRMVLARTWSAASRPRAPWWSLNRLKWSTSIHRDRHRVIVAAARLTSDVIRSSK
jgi:hypothetical protein